MNYDELMKLSLEELKDLKGRIDSVVKIKRESKALSTKQSLSIGDSIILNDKRYDGEEYIIMKINRTRCQARQTKGPKINAIYTIPFSMVVKLEKAEESV